MIELIAFSLLRAWYTAFLTKKARSKVIPFRKTDITKDGPWFSSSPLILIFSDVHWSDELVSLATRGTSNDGVTYSTTSEDVSGLLVAGTAGINHGTYGFSGGLSATVSYPVFVWTRQVSPLMGLWRSSLSLLYRQFSLFGTSVYLWEAEVIPCRLSKTLMTRAVWLSHLYTLILQIF